MNICYLMRQVVNHFSPFLFIKLAFFAPYTNKNIPGPGFGCPYIVTKLEAFQTMNERPISLQNWLRYGVPHKTISASKNLSSLWSMRFALCRASRWLRSAKMRASGQLCSRTLEDRKKVHYSWKILLGF